MKRAIKDWIIILASLLDDAAIAFLVLLLLWFFKVSITPPIIIFLAFFFIATVFVMHRLIIPVIHKKTTTGAEGLIGTEGKVIEPLAPSGVIRITDEYWKARSVDDNIAAGEQVEIISLKGLTLQVKRKRISAKHISP